MGGICLTDMLLWEGCCCQKSVIQAALEGLVRLIQLLVNCLLFAAYPCGQQWQPRETEVNQVGHRALGVQAKDMGALEEIFSILRLMGKSWWKQIIWQLINVFVASVACSILPLRTVCPSLRSED